MLVAAELTVVLFGLKVVASVRRPHFRLLLQFDMMHFSRSQQMQMQLNAAADVDVVDDDDDLYFGTSEYGCKQWTTTSALTSSCHAMRPVCSWSPSSCNRRTHYYPGC